MTRSSCTSHLLTPLLGGLTLSCLTLTATAQEISAKKAVAMQLPEAVVIGQLDTPDIKMLDQLDMRRGLRNDLAEALTMVPSVRVVDTASSSLQQGDLKPAEFSIRGAAAYQNKIMLDGASIDNMLDPANRENESNYTSVAGHSQSVFIDPRFVKELQVIDVNASDRKSTRELQSPGDISRMPSSA